MYVGYPLLIGRLAVLSPRKLNPSAELPSVTVLVAAHQEVEVMRDKLDNFLTLDYPADRLGMVVVSDGSTDGTDEVVREFESPRIKLLRQDPRQGKAAALGLGLAELDSDVVLFTDANVVFDPSAVRRLVRYFGDPAVGVVTGTVHLVDRKRGYAESEGAYYRYERFLQISESSFWSVVGVDGALYASRRELVRAPPREAILDDFVIAMTIAAAGYRIVYEPEAVGYEDAAPTLSDEFRRKVRTSAGAFQSIWRRWGLPMRATPRLLFCYVAHKLLRWLTPWFLVTMLVSNLSLAVSHWLWQVALGAQLLFYALALLGMTWQSPRRWRLAALPMYFCLMNAAVACGLISSMTGSASVRWTPTPRTRTGTG